MPQAQRPQARLQDTSYPTTYFCELSPTRLNYVAALGGFTPSSLASSFRYLELGCGSGFSTVVHAAAFPHAEFHACDINEASIAEGREHAKKLVASNVRFHLSSFDQLAARNLPGFDFIVLHGVYSWVDREARQTLRQLISRLLKPGGLAYVSYNCQPGWAVEIPLRRLIREFARGQTSDSAQQAMAAVRSLDELAQAGLRYFDANPDAARAIGSYLRSPGDYLAHEFLSDDGDPMYSIDVADEMAEAGLSFVGSATLVDNHPELQVGTRAVAAVSALETSSQRQLAMDFAVNRQFRRDVFARTGSSLAEPERRLALFDTWIEPRHPPEAIEDFITVPRGRVHFDRDFVGTLKSTMAMGPTRLGDLATALQSHARDPVESIEPILRNVLYLIAAEVLTPTTKPRQREARA